MFWNKKRENPGKAMIYIEDCRACGECIRKCRRDALGFVEINNERFARLIRPDQCVGCGKCAKVCDYGAIDILSSALCAI